MKAGIIIIGDEILLGQVTDTNSGEIARTLGAIDCSVTGVNVVGDDASAIRSAVCRALDENDLVITTGGLGPTKDDITKHTLAGIFGGGMHYDESVARNVERIFASRGLRLNDLTRAQANVPDNCRVIQNQLGTAPIMWFERDGKVLVSMPGVPFEAVGMMRGEVLRAIKQHFNRDSVLLHHTLIVGGITESDLAELLAEYEERLGTDSCVSMHLAYLPVSGYIRLRLDAIGKDNPQTKAEFDKALIKLKEIVTPYLLHDGDATPAEILIEKLKARGMTVSTAESCTGGNIAHSITEVAGCSEVYYGSVVSYHNEIKVGILGVDKSDIERYGAVSETVVRQMAEGVTRITGTDCSMATSGIAGPGGGTQEKPVGTVWMAVHTPKGTRTCVKRFSGDRARVISRATNEVLLMLCTELG